MAIQTSAPRAAHAEGRTRPGGPHAVGLVIALTAILGVIFLAFALPAARSKPHDVPIGVTGPQPMVAGVQSQLDAAVPDGFALHTYPDDGALRAAILDRDVYGGLALTPAGPTLLTATGGSPMVAQLLTQLGTGMAAHTGMPLHTEDLAPLPARDPRGGGLAAAALPLTLAGLLPAAVLLTVFPTRPWLRLSAFAGAAILAGATIAALLAYAFGSIQGNLLDVTAALTLGILATGLVVLGLGALFGRVGLGIGAATAMLVANPLSALASAPEMLPRGWGALGQLLPQGASATLLRSTAYFSGAGAASAVTVLTCWAAVGVLLIVIAGARRRA